LQLTGAGGLTSARALITDGDQRTIEFGTTKLAARS